MPDAPRPAGGPLIAVVLAIVALIALAALLFALLWPGGGL